MSTAQARASLARRVRAARGYAALTQAELSARARLDCTALRALERGRYSVAEDELERIADACNVPLELLTEGRAELP